MIGSLLLLGLLSFGLAFLVSDARIFGMSSKEYLDIRAEAEELDDAELHDEATFKFQELEQILSREGILRIRNPLLRIRFYRELLSCYFCLGLWCGMAAHWLLVDFSRTSGMPYALAHGTSLWAWLGGLAISGLVGAPLCYGFDLLYGWLERVNG